MSSNRSKVSLVKTRIKVYSDVIGIILPADLMNVVHGIEKTNKKGNTLYVAGNGGSCANAAHLVLHLRESNIRAVDLTADNACITAIANDHSYTEVFRQQLESQAIDGDGLLVISGSGKSLNIIAALEWARLHSLMRLGLLGFGGGDAARLCDMAIILDSSEYGPVEVAHDACIHLIKELLWLDKS